MKPENALRRSKHKYTVVQLYFKPEIGVPDMLCHSKHRKSSIKQHTEYFIFRCEIQLDHPVNVDTWSQYRYVFPLVNPPFLKMRLWLPQVGSEA